MPRLILAGLIALGVVASGCGSTSDDTATTSSPTAAKQTTTAQNTSDVASALLARWRGEIVSALIVFRDRRIAEEAGDADKAASLWRKALREVRPVEKYGRDARKAFVDADPDEIGRTLLTAAGDAWTEWAYTLRTDPPAGDFAKARRIADLATTAFRRMRGAYRALSEPIPPEFRTG